MMSLQSNRLSVRLVVLALIAAALAGCKHGEQWGITYFEIKATPLEFPITEYKLKHPSDFFGISVIQVKDPNAKPPTQRLAIVYSLGAGGDPGDDCTGFFISKRDFLTAGHCVPKALKIDIKLGGRKKTANCSKFPASESWQDWAICSFEEDLALGDTFALTKCTPKPNVKVVVMGFCQLIKQAGDPYPASTPAKVPNAGVLEALAPAEGFLPAQPLTGRRTSACPLDSGGPAFIPERLTRVGNQYAPSGKIRVFGIIADIGTCPPGENKRTCIAPTTNEKFFSFLNDHKTGATTILECTE